LEGNAIEGKGDLIVKGGDWKKGPWIPTGRGCEGKTIPKKRRRKVNREKTKKSCQGSRIEKKLEKIEEFKGYGPRGVIPESLKRSLTWLWKGQSPHQKKPTPPPKLSQKGGLQMDQEFLLNLSLTGKGKVGLKKHRTSPGEVVVRVGEFSKARENHPG